MRIPTAILSISLAALLACAACDTVPEDALERCDSSQVVAGRVKTDILFVIDDSGSMSEEQALVRAGLANFIATLASSPVANDFRIGVTNTSVEDYPLADGSQPAYFSHYDAGPSAGVPYPAGALVAVDPSNITTPGSYGDYYYDPVHPSTVGFYGPQVLDWDSANLTTAFKDNVLVGIHGAGREQPFRAVELALSSQLASGGENVGFLRPGARLAIIFVTDEDDCSGPANTSITNDAQCKTARTNPSSSLLPVAEFASFLQGPLGGESRDVVLAAIAGVTCSGGVCTNTQCGTAFNTPDRILSLLSMFSPARTRVASICDPSFDAALDQFADAILSQTVPLDGAVSDYRMLVAAVTRAGATFGCTIQPADAPAGIRDAADAVYEAPQAGRPASLTFQNACALQQGDTVSVKVVCAR